MKPPLSNSPPRRDDDAGEPASDESIRLDEVTGDGSLPSRPRLETALDDEEGGADPIDPDTGLPYDDCDPGDAAPRTGRTGGTRSN